MPIISVTWTTQEMLDQCRRLEPDQAHLKVLTTVIGMALWDGDARTIDILMASSEFDGDLFIMLTVTLKFNTRTALEVCLS